VNLAGWQFTAASLHFSQHHDCAERLSGGGAQPDQSVRQISQSERRQHGGQLQRQSCRTTASIWPLTMPAEHNAATARQLVTNIINVAEDRR
jgi:hypothetical protein